MATKRFFETIGKKMGGTDKMRFPVVFLHFPDHLQFFFFESFEKHLELVFRVWYLVFGLSEFRQ